MSGVCYSRIETKKGFIKCWNGKDFGIKRINWNACSIYLLLYLYDSYITRGF